MDFDLSKCATDYATATAHKIGGPRGIGILYVKEGAPFHSLIYLLIQEIQLDF